MPARSIRTALFTVAILLLLAGTSLAAEGYRAEKIVTVTTYNKPVPAPAPVAAPIAPKVSIGAIVPVQGMSFTSLDTDQSGLVTQVEFQTAGIENDTVVFQRIDIDNDRHLTESEINSYTDANGTIPETK